MKHELSVGTEPMGRMSLAAHNAAKKVQEMIPDARVIVMVSEGELRGSCLQGYNAAARFTLADDLHQHLEGILEGIMVYNEENKTANE